MFLSNCHNSETGILFAGGHARAKIIDYPASYHNGAAGLSFADGHAEIRKWQDPRTVVKVKFAPMPLNVASANNRDMVWLSDRTTIKILP